MLRNKTSQKEKLYIKEIELLKQVVNTAKNNDTKTIKKKIET